MTALPYRMEDSKGAVGLSVSPGNLIVVAYFFGPILAGLANRHLHQKATDTRRIYYTPKKRKLSNNLLKHGIILYHFL